MLRNTFGDLVLRNTFGAGSSGFTSVWEPETRGCELPPVLRRAQGAVAQPGEGHWDMAGARGSMAQQEQPGWSAWAGRGKSPGVALLRVPPWGTSSGWVCVTVPWLNGSVE